MQITRQENQAIITLDASQYSLDILPNYLPHLVGSYDALPGEIIHADEERLEIAYQIPTFGQSIGTVIAEGTLLERLELARKFSALLAWQRRVANPRLHPDNLFLVGGQLKVAHRGLEGYIEPKSCSEEAFLVQYKALVVSTIESKYSFTALSSGEVKVRDPLCTKIVEAEKIAEVEAILDEEIQKHQRIDKQTKRLVKKSSFTLFRTATIVLGVLALGLGIWLGITMTERVPLQERIIESQAAFMVNNFGEAVSVLQGDSPENLPASVQYVLAASFIQLENLTLQQQNEILNQLSPASSENELLYWVYVGRGEFYTALDIALNIGDNQIVLHAYTKLYDMVYADPVMPGAEKQQRLDQYRGRINELLELFNSEGAVHE